MAASCHSRRLRVMWIAPLHHPYAISLKLTKHRVKCDEPRLGYSVWGEAEEGCVLLQQLHDIAQHSVCVQILFHKAEPCCSSALGRGTHGRLRDGCVARSSDIRDRVAHCAKLRGEGHRHVVLVRHQGPRKEVVEASS